MRRLLIPILLVVSPPSFAKDLLIFGGDNHDEFLGCLNCSEYDSNSVCNGYGSFGNEFSSSGIWNEFAGFGNEFSSDSPWNEFSTSKSVPVVVDRDGGFYGYFTINIHRSDAVEFAPFLKQLFDITDGDLEKVRINLCKSLGYSG